MQWQDCVDHSADNADEQEFIAWLLQLLPPVRRDVVARMDELQDLAARGEIQVPQDVGEHHDLDAVRRDPDLYELRWTILTKLVRQYHAEPTRFPDHLIRLHLHIKADRSRPRDDARERQERAISKAIDQYRRGDTENWGIQ